ncbi:39S ribosomal protein L45 [Pyrus ussuriensis x Pyrus communis]|uniref:39S ribosomal protein L45 n=1 Tax=Pyrus ussuriensis x Pyrus communis TaxID=2448454 RepID=A0A5N5HQJ9_9ROSA|nr:39S ribosomal protein L45 [Pyrus ussuriensis x Pyrus communis]
MDRREEHFQFLGICQRLYNFITRSLASQRFKTVKLGPPMNQGYPETAISEAGTRRGQKKMVSIHHRVEDIDEVMKVRRKSLKKLKCLELGRDDPRPLRSILKVGSDLEREDGHI